MASRSASPRTPRWSGCRSAAADLRGAARPVPRHRARGCRSRQASRAPRPRRPPGWPTGRRCTRTSSGSAWCTPSARAARPRCSSARWRPEAGGRGRYGRALSAAGFAVATVGAYLGGHLALRLGAGTSHRRVGQPPVRARLARPVRAARTARPAPDPPPARLPVPARVPAGSRGQRAVRPVLPSRRAPASGTGRPGAGRCLHHLSLARIHLRDRRRHRRARARYRPSAILRDPRDDRRAGRTAAPTLTGPAPTGPAPTGPAC